MKSLIAKILVVTVLIVLSFYLYVTGQEHTIFLTNKGKEYTPKVAYYTIDSNKKMKVKANKKAKAYVKGRSHIINVEFKDTNGEQKLVSREFKISSKDNYTINIAELDNDSQWVENKK